MFQYQGRTALVTGASVGIGRAFACELARRGMSLVLVARAQKMLQELADQLQRDHQIQAHVNAADLSLEASIPHIVQQLAERQLTVDLLVNNAGFKTYGHFENISPPK